MLQGAGSGSDAYQQLLRERDELQSMLNKFERHMAEIQSNVKVLTQERDKTNVLYEQVIELNSNCLYRMLVGPMAYRYVERWR